MYFVPQVDGKYSYQVCGFDVCLNGFCSLLLVNRKRVRTNLSV